jgi:hypothetical protein
MVKITKILYAGGAAPYQLEAMTSIGRNIYLRYRGGRLRWGFMGKNGLTPDKYEFAAVIGDEYDGWPDDKLFKSILKDQLEFPLDFKFEFESYETKDLK